MNIKKILKNSIFISYLYFISIFANSLLIAYKIFNNDIIAIVIMTLISFIYFIIVRYNYDEMGNIICIKVVAGLVICTIGKVSLKVFGLLGKIFAPFLSIIGPLVGALGVCMLCVSFGHVLLAISYFLKYNTFSIRKPKWYEISYASMFTLMVSR